MIAFIDFNYVLIQIDSDTRILLISSSFFFFSFLVGWLVGNELVRLLAHSLVRPASHRIASSSSRVISINYESTEKQKRQLQQLQLQEQQPQQQHKATASKILKFR